MRLFVGLYPPEEVVRDLPRRTGREHVTLAFLGEVADPAPLAAALERVAGLLAPRLAFGGIGSFRGEAVWLGLVGDRDALFAVHAAVRAAVLDAGLPVDPAPWRPHLTVGRGAVPPDLLSYESPEAVWREVALIRSTLSRSGAVHERLRTYELAEPDRRQRLQ